jgi:hydrogenase expression/formation protein HypD
MRYVDEYRAPEQVMQLVEHLRQRARLLPHTADRPLRIMEVCGGHTHAIFKFGLDQLLPENIEFIHGPGCPVCVLPMGRIDACIDIASRPGVIFCTLATPCACREKRLAAAGEIARRRRPHRLFADGRPEAGAAEPRA